jgi:hypothetical protein
MHDRLLGYLTGRINFDAPLRALDPGHTSPMLDSMRAALCLDQDWAAVGLLAAVECEPDLWRLLPHDPLFVAAAWTRPEDVWDGGKLVPDMQGPPLSIYRPDSWPADKTWRLSRLDARQAVLSSAYKRFVIPCGLTGSDITQSLGVATGRLTLAWPAALGWRGDVLLYVPWDVAEVRITHIPEYPAEQVVAVVSDRPELSQILSDGGTLEAWHAASSAMGKLAALGTAIIHLAAGTPPQSRISAAPPAARTTPTPTNT